MTKLNIGYSHIGKEGNILTGPFKTEKEANYYNGITMNNYYKDCKVEKVNTNKIYLFKGFKNCKSII